MADKESPTTKRTVLITGCSDDGLSAALAIAFHEAGLHVYATARDPSKMTHIASLGIETLTLDVQSDSSIAACVQNLSKKLFDLNVWSYLAVTQAFSPLLLKSEGIIVNKTSILSSMTIPFQSVYNASKAAMAAFSDTQRLELAPFGITVVDLKTGGSIYEPAKEAVEKVLRSEDIGGFGDPGGAVGERCCARSVAKDTAAKYLERFSGVVGAACDDVAVWNVWRYGTCNIWLKKKDSRRADTFSEINIPWTAAKIVDRCVVAKKGDYRWVDGHWTVAGIYGRGLWSIAARLGVGSEHRFQAGVLSSSAK